MSAITPIDALTKYSEVYAKTKLSDDEYNSFVSYFDVYKKDVEKAKKNGENEEFIKGYINDFLKDTLYKKTDGYIVNNYGYIDSSIVFEDDLQVIIETKNIKNTNEMLSTKDINKKALHELILYYLEQTRDVSGSKAVRKTNSKIKNLIATNGIEWFVFDAITVENICTGYLEKHFYHYKNNILLYAKDNSKFYQDVQGHLNKQDLDKIKYIYFDVSKIKSKKDISTIQKLLSPTFLIKDRTKLPVVEHTLNKGFYHELLYIFGLQEVKEKGNAKIIINLESPNTIAYQLYNKYKYEKELKDEEQIVDKVFELIIIWLDRLLFIKLFEGQLVSFNNDDENYKILSNAKIRSFNDLMHLFFDVLGKREREKSDFYNQFVNIPYLNSALFERQQIEKSEININALTNDNVILKNNSVLGKRKTTKELPLLEYIINFLNSYNFCSDKNANNFGDGIREIIDASVLGLIFEKINGYKDGSFYTPSQITEYICKKTITNCIINKINKHFKWDCKSISDIKLYIDEYAVSERNKIRKQIDSIINSITICDPSVGSGHFLVSALNTIIAVKSELGVLFYYNTSERIDYNITIINDVLTVCDAQGNYFFYDKTKKESQLLQETLFNEKRIIIENCLFGADINKKAVYICQLRLWIELLKNAYYKNEVMETLPNIDIKLKSGNSLIQTLSFDIDQKINSKKTDLSKKDIERYKAAVNSYKSENDKSRKSQLNDNIYYLKTLLYSRWSQLSLDDENNYAALYNDSLEWALEFPEILTNDGSFLGFDCVIGNPPYIDSETMTKQMPKERKYYTTKYSTAKGNWDIFVPFMELSYKLCKKDGYIAFITPNKLIAADYARALRKFMSKYSIIELRDYSNVKVFKEASVYPITFVARKSQNVSEITVDVMENEIDKSWSNTFDRNAFFSTDKWDSFFAKNTRAHEIITNLVNKYAALEKIASVNGAATVSEAYEIKELLSEDPYNESTHFKFVNTGTIDPYVSLWENNKTQYIKQGFIKPVISRVELKRNFPNRFEEANSEKIIIGGMTKQLECYYDNGKTLAGKSTTIVYKSNLPIKYIIGLLNSELLTSFYKVYFNSLSLQGGFYRIGAPQIKQLPIAIGTEQQIEKLINAVDKAVVSYDISVQNEINKIVYEIYNISNEEIQILNNI